LGFADGRSLSIGNIYASNNALEWVGFWHWMVEELSEANWSIYGNLNMVKSLEDQEGLPLIFVVIERGTSGSISSPI
jgi:hypothetical protein